MKLLSPIVALFAAPALPSGAQVINAASCNEFGKKPMKCWLLFIFLLSLPAFAQTSCPAYSSGILASSRIVDWCKNAGLPSTLPDNEITPNAWTPPSRTQCGSTISAGASATTINSALAACSTGTYVLLGSGTFSLGTGTISLGNQNGVTLRGSGADQTKLTFSGGGGVTWENTSGGNTLNNATWSAGYSQGTTSITVNSNTGLTANKSIITLYQCNDGTSGIPNCESGSVSIGTGIVVCGTTACSTEGGPPQAQSQVVLVTSIASAGGGNYTLGISPGLYMANWNSSATPFASGYTSSWGDGLEDLSIDGSATTDTDIASMAYTYASWVKGVRFVGADNDMLRLTSNKSCLVLNNYFYATVALGGNVPEPMIINTDSDNLILNNIFQIGAGPYAEGGSAGDVFAFNYARDGYSNSGQETFMGNVVVNHDPGESFYLVEGDEMASFQDDDIHGTHNLDTVFRSLLSANDPPYTKSSGIVALEFAGYSRFANIIGNVLGSSTTTNYQSTSSSTASNPVYILGAVEGSNPTDSVTLASAMRWGNWDAVNAAVRWQPSEVPTSLSGLVAAAFENSVPSSETLPASFFLPITAHPSGGTGLNWWKVCTNYPTCSTSQTQPFPPIGPDVTGGSVIGGYNYGGLAYDIPAALAWKDLPIDTTYQSSYTITGSSYSSGTETLTISGFSGTPVGEFQVTGTCAGTFVATTSTGTTVSYAVTSNPGSCTGGSVLYPDVRTFNELVYETDLETNPAAPSAPVGLAAVVK